MKCPHCLESFHEDWSTWELGSNKNLYWYIVRTTCPACGRFVMMLKANHAISERPEAEILVYPKAPSRAPLDASVPEEFANDYHEAAIVLPDSPKASAALSRRCLQHLLREKGSVKHSNLNNEIDEAMPSLPSHLAGAVDAVRQIGNFAAHPTKSERTGEVVNVEPGEAEWNLDTLEGLFDHYFTQPALLERKRNELNAKLADAGKPELKG